VSLIKQLVETLFTESPIEEFADKLMVIGKIKQEIRLYIGHHNKSNRKTKHMIYLLTALKIQLNIIEGNFSDVIYDSIDLLHRPELYIPNDFMEMDSELKNNDGTLFAMYSVLYNSIQLSVAYNNIDLKQKLSSLGDGLIKAIQFLNYSMSIDAFGEGLSELQMKYANKQYEIGLNIMKLNSLYFIDADMIGSCIDYVYKNSPKFGYRATAFALEQHGNSLVIKHRDIIGEKYEQVFVVIDDISNKEI
jgi:hypothetical protein